MRSLIILIFLSFCVSVKAQMRLAIINDSDGYTNVRSGQGAFFESIGIINKDEFFNCESSSSDWWKVTSIDRASVPFEGFIHKSRVQFVQNLSDTTKQILLNNILTNHKQLAERYSKTYEKYDHTNGKWNNSTDSILSVKAGIKYFNYSDSKYSPILDILPQYFCKSIDTLMLQLFLTTLWADNGSANESPSYAIGECFICQPDLLVEKICKIKNKEEREFIFSEMEFGILNEFDVDEHGASKNKEYYVYKKKFENGRKKAKL